ncbi:MAG: ATPase [Lachnospiraceae bacterium]|nr:ATPase [Lachnospiraceae bacterium]
MDNATVNYREMYEAEVMIPAGTPGNPTGLPQFVSEPTFWYGECSFTVELTNKMSLDRPTILCQIPAENLGIDTYETTVADYCYREFLPYLEEMNEELYNRHKTPEQTGYYFMVRPGGEVLERNTAYFAMRPRKDYDNGGGNIIVHRRPEEVGEPQMCLSMRYQVQLPAKRLKKAIQMLTADMPMAVALFEERFNRSRVRDVIELANKQRELRAWLRTSEYCAFLANGSILPREAKTELPMEGAIPFTAPPEEEIEACGIKGLGIRRGVTVITGGGYSGKSTILDTIAAGIYDHVLGDGRELCVTDQSAMSIGAEDGRCIKNIDISPFISWVPGGETEDFSTDHASGSTSQAANILEAIDCGSKLLLIDEDRSATNFMIRDRLMKELIRREPITPFTERVNELYEACGVSTILVIGGSGEYLSVADTVYMMEEYVIYNVTETAKELGGQAQSGRESSAKGSGPKAATWTQNRRLKTEGFTSYPEQAWQEKLAVPDIDFIMIGAEKIDTRSIANILCREQRTSIGFMIRLMENRQNGVFVDLKDEVERIFREIAANGLDTIYSGFFPECERFLAMPRVCDLYAVINRMRRLTYGKLKS